MLLLRELALVTTSTWPWPELAGEASGGQYARMLPSCWPASLPNSRPSLLLLPWLLGLQDERKTQQQPQKQPGACQALLSYCSCKARN
jgi:hypothetical protein